MTSPAPVAETSPNKLDAVFRAMKGSADAGETTASPMTLQGVLPWALLVAAGVLMYVAIRNWHRKRTAPGALKSHRKLLAEAARMTPGVSKRQMKALAGLANNAGLSSPLVALVCPSAIGRLAGQIRDDRQRVALRAVAEGIVRTQRKASQRSEAMAGHAGR